MPAHYGPWAALLTGPLCRSLRFDATRNRFVKSGKSFAGLTAVLAKCWPRPVKHSVATCAFCKQRRRGAKLAASSTSRGKQVVGLLKPKGKRSTLMMPRQHGSLVDEEIAAWTVGGARAVPHPNAVTRALILYMTETRGWRPVAAQVPVLLPFLGRRATAIDLLCTDVATQTQRILIEVKSTQGVGRDACYRAEPPRNGAAGVPRSAWARDQLQLWAMDRALRMDGSLHVDEAVVLRASPAGVRCYALDREAWDEKADKLMRAMHK